MNSKITILVLLIALLLPSIITAQAYNKELLFNQATDSLVAGNYNKAIALYSKYIDDFPEDNALINRAIAYSKVGDLCGFCNDLNRVKTEMYPDVKEAYNSNCFQLFQVITTSAVEKEIYGVDSIFCYQEVCNDEKSYDLIYTHYEYLSNNPDSIFPVYIESNEMPKYKSGEEAMEKFILKNINYPDNTILNNDFEIVDISFIVEKDGRLTNIKADNFTNYLYALEALRIVRTMPPWQPGKNNGKKVRTFVTIPIRFEKPVNFENELENLKRKYLVQNDTCALCRELKSNPNDNKFIRSTYPFCFSKDSLTINDNDIRKKYKDYSYSIAYSNKCNDDIIFYHYNALNESLNNLDEVSIPPLFPGGEAAMKRYLSVTIDYPQEARERGIQGIVYVKFKVLTDGSISNVEILKSPDSILSKEAIRVVKSMPKWVPGKINNKPVKVVFNMPIKFTLQN